MTLRDTELIGKKLVKYRFYRDNEDHQLYQYWGITRAGGIYVEFKRYGGVWAGYSFLDSWTFTSYGKCL
jgi:hypothetical protein